MSRNRLSVGLVILFLATPILAKSHVPAQNTHAAIEKYVHEAASLVAAKGPDCAALGSADWKGGDYYVFVVGPDNKLICHPTLAGKSANDIVDTKGTKVGLALIEAGKKKGGGWVEYVWPRPGTTVPVPKSSYALEVKGPDGKSYNVGAGGYELK